MGITIPTPIQMESYSVILSGRNVVGVSQTGTGKTLAFMLPILQDLKYSENIPPTVLVIVPTRELVLQVVNNIEAYAKYKTVRVLGVYGGANIKKQKEAVAKGVDILVATPGRLYDIEEEFAGELGIIHSNKSQNFRIRNIEAFDAGDVRILIATDIMARGLDLDKITHVINLDTPSFPENYMHRIGRTGRAEQEGNSILFFTEKETESKEEIEELMDYEIPQLTLPEDLVFSQQLLPEERKRVGGESNYNRNDSKKLSGAAFHEKSEKNSVNLGGKGNALAQRNE
ncbi:UNVERIFIED_CONTAM: hypothetical protein GTU68_027495 [Idotea baltica]|nr:hypothetical protein [Idotea baltica]